jgi:hypothetical protein
MKGTLAAFAVVLLIVCAGMTVSGCKPEAFCRACPDDRRAEGGVEGLQR